MHITLRRVAAAAIVLPVLVLTAACGSDEKASENAMEKAIEENTGGDVDVDVDDEEVSIETDEGTVSYGSKDRPESLPDDFPLPEGEIVTSMDSPTGAMVSMKVEGDLGEAFDSVVAELEDQGWKRDYISKAEDTASAALNGESEEESVIVNADLEAGEMTFVVSLAS